MMIISACLIGINCKYNGKNNLCEDLKKLVDEGKAFPICPEQLGGLSTPRISAEIKKNAKNSTKIITKNGDDVTQEFFLGAERALKIAKILNTEVAILKSKSPSCGYGKIYDGNFSGNLIEGNGITAELFMKNGIKVIKR